MVACENAETAGVIRDRLVKSKLGRKIRDRLLDRGARARLPIGILALQIFLEGVVHLLQLAQEILVLRNFLKPSLPGELQHANGIVVRPIPEFGIQVTEQSARGGLPRPP